MKNSTNYLFFLDRDIKNGFYPNIISNKKIREITLLESKIAILKSNAITLFNKEKSFFINHEDHLPDYFMEAVIKQGVIDGICQRYPKGWILESSDKITVIGNEDLEEDFSIWSQSFQQYIIEQIPDCPIYKINSIGEYIIFIAALFISDFNIIKTILEGKNIDKKIFFELLANFDEGEILLANFFLYKAYFNKLRSDKDLLNRLRIKINKNRNKNLNKAVWQKNKVNLSDSLEYNQLGAMLNLIINYEEFD